MKDQIKLLRTCFNNDIPAVVFQGDDKCVPEILEAALSIYKQKGCSAEFLYDFQLLINEVKAYQKEFPNRIKIPGLSTSETELIRADMDNKKAQVCNTWEKEALQAEYEDYSMEKVVSGKFGIIESGLENRKKYGLVSDRLYEYDNKDNDQLWFYPFTGGCISLNMKTGIRHEGARIVSIEVVSDDVARNRYGTLLKLS